MQAGPTQFLTETTMTIDDLTQGEIDELELRAKNYHIQWVKQDKKIREDSGVFEEFTEDDLQKLELQNKIYLEKLKRDYLKEKKAKLARIKKSEYVQNITINEVEPVKIKAIEPVQNFTSRQYWDMVIPALNELVDLENQGEVFQFNDKLEFMLKMLCHYWAEDDRFFWYCGQKMDGRPIIIDGRPNLNKGLGFFGSNGVGKSLFQKAFRYNPRLSYTDFNAKLLPGVYEKGGFTGLSQYCNPQIGNRQLHYGQQKIGLALDELYAEGVGYHYKDSSETAEYVMYQRWETLPGFHTHFTTNHKLSELEKRYGSRFFDRMMGKTNLILFPKMPSFRQ